MDDACVLVADAGGERLDRFVARLVPELTRSRVRRLIKDGLITVDGRLSGKAGVMLDAGARVSVTLPPPELVELAPEAVSLRIVYEDDDLLVVDKPAVMPVHPAPGHSANTLVNALLSYAPQLSSVGAEGRPGIVHRLDKDTSGLIIVAKNDAAHASLSRQLKQRQVEKTYVALVEGVLERREGVIDAPLGRHPSQRKRQAVVARGRDARTRYRVLREIDGRTLIEAYPETGRTHQIRVHLASIGHPVSGDRVYGRARALAPSLHRQFLHAARLAFLHPSSGQHIELSVELPEDLRAVLAELEG